MFKVLNGLYFPEFRSKLSKLQSTICHQSPKEKKGGVKETKKEGIKRLLGRGGEGPLISLCLLSGLHIRSGDNTEGTRLEDVDEK